MRPALIVASLLLLALAIGLFACSGAFPGGIMLLVWAVVTVAGVVCERTRYKPLLDSGPGPDWRPTSEKFIDPTSGATVVVHVQASTGRRAYVRA
ncbi:hypothetical protein [Phenylobacterium sp.]|jgi:hypothetical protein|uniref:hypothetical protein n=1 Tax=Phenylobacterium sp. TaxID=1871053 RepID=UPI002F3F7B4C